MKIYPESSFPLEARRFLVRLSILVLVVWYGLLFAGGATWLTGSGWTTFVLPVWWTVLTVIFVQDRDCRFRLLYEGALGAVAYFLLHDVPHMLGFYWIHDPFAHAIKLILTGFLAALPFGARGAGVSAVSGAMLCGLWFLYGMASGDFSVVDFLSGTFMRGFFLILMGGLMAERATRSIRRHGDQGHAHPALFVVVALISAWQLFSYWR